MGTVAARLRALAVSGEGVPVKILLVSANAHEFAAGGDGGAAHDGFVTKPVVLEALLDAIASQLGLDWLSDEAAPADAALPAARSGRPAGAHIAELRRLGQAGHIRGLEAGLNALADELPASRPLVEQLRSHVRAFDLEGFLRHLDAHGSIPPMPRRSWSSMTRSNRCSSSPRRLEAAGMTVLVAGNGAAALQSLALVMPDLVLMDAVMPGDGRL